MTGYVTIDCTGIDLGNLGTVTGIYEKFLSAVKTGKMMLLENVKNGTQNFSPIPAYGQMESTTSVFCSFFPVTIHISNLDVITM